MEMSTKSTPKDILETLLEHASKKIGAKKESDICRYLKDGEGKMHHLTFKKMKVTAPVKLSDMIKQQIIECANPQKANPKQRQFYKKGRATVSLSNPQMRIIYEALIKQGETELAKRFEVEPSIKQMKQMVLRSIQGGEPDKELIQSYLQRLESEKD